MNIFEPIVYQKETRFFCIMKRS